MAAEAEAEVSSKKDEGDDVEMEWLEQVAALLLRFEEFDSAIVREMKRRAEFFIKVLEVRGRPCESSVEIIAMLRGLSEAWMMETSIRSMTSASKHEAMQKEALSHPKIVALRAFVDEMATLSISPFTTEVARCALGGDLATPEVIAVCEELRGVLPSNVGSLLEGHKVFGRLKRISGQIDEGKTVGALEIAGVLADAATAAPLFKQKPVFVKCEEAVRVKWTFYLSSTLSKCDLSFLDEYQKTYECVTTAIEAWNFSGMAWIQASEPAPEKVAETMKLEKMISGFPIAARVIEGLGGTDLSWAVDEDRNKVQSMVAALPGLKQKLIAAMKPFASTMLVNGIFQEDLNVLDTTRKYVRSKFKIEDCDLPTKLRQKIAEKTLQTQQQQQQKADSSSDKADEASAVPQGPTGTKFRKVLKKLGAK